MNVLVTGATGTLGKHLVPQLRARNATVRIFSRGPAPASLEGLEWRQGDVIGGEGLLEAVQGVDVLVHAAHDRRSAARDVQGVRTVLQAATEAGVSHLVYVSIVGVAEVPGFWYYEGKAAGERLVRESSLKTSIFRATQFFDLIDGFLRGLDRLPWLLVPKGLRFQPVDVQEVAAALAAHALRGEAGEIDVAGPEVRSFRDLAAAWLQAHGKRKAIIEVPVPHKTVRAIAQGKLTSSTAVLGHKRWETWLESRASSEQPTPEVHKP